MSDLVLRTREGWWRFGLCWRPEWGTGTGWPVTGLVKRWGVRVGPLGFYAARLDNPSWEEWRARQRGTR